MDFVGPFVFTILCGFAESNAATTLSVGCFRLITRRLGRLVGWFVSWLVGWLVGLLVGWLVGWLVDDDDGDGDVDDDDVDDDDDRIHSLSEAIAFLTNQTKHVCCVHIVYNKLNENMTKK